MRNYFSFYIYVFKVFEVDITLYVTEAVAATGLSRYTDGINRFIKPFYMVPDAKEPIIKAIIGVLETSNSREVRRIFNDTLLFYMSAKAETGLPSYVAKNLPGAIEFLRLLEMLEDDR